MRVAAKKPPSLNSQLLSLAKKGWGGSLGMKHVDTGNGYGVPLIPIIQCGSRLDGVSSTKSNKRVLSCCRSVVHP